MPGKNEKDNKTKTMPFMTGQKQHKDEIHLKHYTMRYVHAHNESHKFPERLFFGDVQEDREPATFESIAG